MLDDRIKGSVNILTMTNSEKTAKRQIKQVALYNKKITLKGEIMKRSLGISGNMKKVAYAGILLTGLSPSLSFAAPAITNSTGTISTGGAVTISGSGFGSHTMQVESLQSNIETGTTGQTLSKSGWDLNWNGYGPQVAYATDAHHSGSKSIKCGGLNADTSGMCAFAYKMPSVTAGQMFYASWWVRYLGTAGNASPMQWKMFRASKNETIVDGQSELMISNWFDYQQLININPGASGSSSHWLGGLPAADGKWYRVELEWKASSTNTANGSATIRVTSDSGVIEIWTSPQSITHVSSSDNWSYAIWQNYVGNNSPVKADIWFDDPYVQYNTPARIELCSGSTWTNRGKCEIQVPTVWSASSISATVNAGNFSSGSTAYLYIVDSTGAANGAGNQVKIGGSSATPPAPVLNTIKIQ